MERPKIEELAKGIFWIGGRERPRDMSREALEETFRKAKEKGLDIVGVSAFRGRVSTGEDAEERALFPTEHFPVDDEARGRNLLKEQVEIAHGHGLLVLTYLNAHHYGDRFYERHREWAQVFPDGRPMDKLYGRGYTMCVNTSYRDRMFRMIREVARQGVDLIFLDGPAYYPGCCYCSYCRGKFRERYGEEIPMKEDWRDPLWRKFVRFRYESIRDFLVDAHRVLKEEGFKTWIYSNTSGQTWPVWSFALSPEDLWEGEDIIGMESYQYYARPEDVPVWLYGWTTKFGRSVKKDKPFFLFLSGAHENWTKYSVPDAEMRMAIAQGIANGVNILEDRPQAGEFIDFTRRWRNALKDLESLANVALVWSKRTGDYAYEEVVRGPLEAQAGQAGEEVEEAFQTGDYFEASQVQRFKREGERRFVEEVRGFYEALIRLHVPFDLLGDSSLTPEGLSRYDLLILPDVECMGEGAVEAIRDFVGDGGGLVASYRTSLRDEFGDERKDFGLKDVLGVGYLGGTLGPLRWDYMRVKGGHPVVEGVPEFCRFPGDDLLACPEYCLKVEARDGEVLGVQLEPQPARYWGETPETSYPTIVARRYGGGVVYFPGNFGAQYWAQGFLDYLRTIGNALRWASRGEPPVAVEGPEALEVTAYRGREGLVVFLVNYQYSVRRPFREVVSIGEVKVSLKVPHRPDRVVRMTTGQDILFFYEGGLVRFVVPNLGLYEGVLVQP